MQLIIAEKPGVAQTIGEVLGATDKKNGYLVGTTHLITWCIGHLVELAQPNSYDERYAKWKWDDLPILPDEWQYNVSLNTRRQFDTIRKLINDPKVETIVCATDAGREGELIFRLVYHQCGCTKPIKRLWISSLEKAAIRTGFENLHDGREYESLYQAALCRQQADWLVGINASRIFSLLYN
ncbi:MAG: DNA topoisomerase III, partial [Clostridia bacterium]|nr:DNA topoisomerase III [Clostridia bacterium]